jgi:hypothetical protein
VHILASFERDLRICFEGWDDEYFAISLWLKAKAAVLDTDGVVEEAKVEGES